MDFSNQSQHSGNNSTQVQIDSVNNTFNIVNGIDESRARVICREEYQIERQKLSSEAKLIADTRVQQLEDRLMPKMIALDNSLKMFANPNFQFILRKAQLSALLSEKESDYDILSELLVHRVEQQNNKERCLGIHKAIDIVPMISDSALVGLTIFYVLLNFIPRSSDIRFGLSVLDNLYQKILEKIQLPKGSEWLEHLELLSAIRIDSSGINSLKKFDEFIPLLLSDYLISGIDKTSKEYLEIKNKFEKEDIPTQLITQNPLKPGNVYLNIPSDIDKLEIVSPDGTKRLIKLNERQRNTIKEVRPILNCIEKSPELKKELVKMCNSFSCLKLVKDWWDQIPFSFSITPAGKALANAYAHGKDSKIPISY